MLRKSYDLLLCCAIGFALVALLFVEWHNVPRSSYVAIAVAALGVALFGFVGLAPRGR